MKIKRWTLIEGVCLIIYKILLDLAYVFFICDKYGYYLTFKVDFSVVRFIEGWIFFLLLVIALPRRKTITSFYLLMQFVISIVPMLVIYGLYQRSRFFIYLICFVHGMQCVLEKCIDINIGSMRSIKQSGLINKVIIILVTVFSVGMTLGKFGIPGLQAFDFNNVYVIREQHTLSGVLSYIVFWFFVVILPFVFVHSLEKKKWSFLFLFSLIALFLYLTYAHKSWLLSIFFVTGIYIACKKGWYTRACCIGLPLLSLLSMLCYMISEKLIMIPSLFIRRVLFVPADIKFEYYDFFQNAEKLHFSEGLIGKIFGLKSGYDKSIALIIGEELGDPGSSCNTGYLADAYANAGTVGVVLFALLLFVILKALDVVLKKEHLVLNFSILSYSLFGLNDGSLLTRLLTGGLALLIVMLILDNSTKEKHGVLGEKNY